MHEIVITLNRFAEVWSMWIFRVSCQLTVFAALVFALTRFLRGASPNVRHWLWMLVFLKLLLPPGLYAPWSMGTFLTRLEEAPRQSVGLVQKVFTPVPHRVSPPDSFASKPYPLPDGPSKSPTSPGPTPPIPPARTPTAQLPSRLSEEPQALMQTNRPWPPLTLKAWAMIGWIGGAFGLFLATVLRYWRLVGHTTRGSSPASEETLDLVEGLCHRMGLRIPVLVRRTAELETPAVLCVLPPVILVPDAWDEKADPEERAHVMAHEIAHIKRGDAWLGMISTLSCFGFWFHPVLWWVDRNARREREMACDRLAVKHTQAEPDRYAKTLVQAAERFRGSVPVGAGLLGVFETTGNLLERIRSVHRATGKSRLASAAAMVSFIVALLLLPMATRPTIAGETPKTEAPAAAKTEGPPRIVSTAPPAGATDVDLHLSEISVTFDRDMARGFSWTGGGQVYPQVTDRPQWVDNRTCVLPVKLEEGRYYRVGINSRSRRNFKAAYGAPALPTAIYFCTKGSSAQTKQKVQVPEVVRLVPANGAKDVSPETKEIQVTFSVPVGGGFSWTGGGVNYPKGAGNPYWSDDGKTCTRPVRLRPGWNYRLGLNSPSHNNFQSRWGVPLPPVVWTFSTSGQTPRQGETTEESGEPASKAPPAVPAWVSPHSPARDSTYALEFDGVSGFVEVPDSPTLDLTELTLEAWIKFEVGGDNNPRIISKGWEVRTGYELAVYGTGEERRLAFLAKNLGRTYSNALLRAGEWYHVAATFDGSSVSLYVNGEPDISRKVTGGLTPVSIPTNDVALEIGRNSQTSRDMFKGAIDEVRIWNVARSPEAIGRDMSRRLTGKEPGLVAYWRFGEGEGDIVHDSTSNRNNGRLLKASVPEKASSPSDDGPLEASDRDYLIGWFKMTERDTLIPVFKRDGTYHSVSMGFEVPLEQCAEGLSGMDGTTIGFDEASNTYYIAFMSMDSRQSELRDGIVGIGEKKPMTRIDKPSGLLDPAASAPRTNDDFLGWYQPVWFPWWRFEIRKEGERYLLVEEELDGPREAPVWKSSRAPDELTALPHRLGFAPGPRGQLSLTYNDALKRFEMTVRPSHALRMPVARIPAPPSPEGDAVPRLGVRIGIPSSH